MSIVDEVKRKREFSRLPDSVVERAAKKSGDDVKGARALLRKYFGVFLTNKVVRGKGDEKEILESHMSSKKRDYDVFYHDIFDGISGVHSVVDLGCGANGYSYPKLKEEIGSVDYVGVDAAGQLVENMNKFFEEKLYLARAECLDLFDVEKVIEILKKQDKKRCVFLFQVVDALENLEKDFSKKFISRIFEECELMVVSLPTESIGGRKKFKVLRKWIIDFLNENYSVVKDFEKNGERILILEK